MEESVTDDKWNDLCLIWYAIGWHARAERANVGTADLLAFCTGLLFRVARLEQHAATTPFARLAGLFG